MFYAIAVMSVAIIMLGLFGFVLMKRESPIEARLRDLDMTARGLQSNEPSLIERLMSEDRRDDLTQRLARAGWFTVTPRKFILWSAAAAIGMAGVGVALAFFVFAAVNLTSIGAVLVMAVVGAAFPNYLLGAAIKKRAQEIHRAIPDFLDLIASAVEAGLALNGALNTAVEDMTGPLADAFRHALSDIRMGRARAEAFSAMAVREQQQDLTLLVTTLNQVERVGGNIGRVLEDLSEDARDKRMMRAEELAAQLPVKLIFPLALFMLPALFVIIFGAVAGSVMQRQ
jgi:tight adherence protein C